MKTRLLSVLLALVSSVHAQFYAPETDFHDVAQRLFPVEAARVLAWMRNQTSPQIAEVNFEVQTTPAGETAWKIRWLDKDGTLVREKPVRYAAGLLLEGPVFYREVLKQLAAEDWQPVAERSDRGAAVFWEGAQLVGFSRMETTAAAHRLLADSPGLKKPAEAVRLAGLLTHGALPALGSRVMLDGLLLSRAAAWLSISEWRTRERMDAPWASILYLAGREALAGQLWQKRLLKTQGSTAERFWNLVLNAPSVKDGFLFAARKENRQFAMPTMMIFAWMDKAYGRDIVEVAEPVFGKELWSRLYDYAPAVAARGGHLTSEAPDVARRAWVAALRIFAEKPSGLVALDETLAAVRPEALAGDRFPAGLNATAPLEKLGIASVALAPVAHLTIHDVLGFGWESELLQVSAQHRILRRGMLVHKEAREMARQIFEVLPGAELFLDEPETKPVLPPVEPARLQFVLGSPAGLALPKSAASLENARLALRRCWLHPAHAGAQLEALARAPAPADETAKLIARIRMEGGPLSEVAILSRMVLIDQSEHLRRLPDALKREIAARLPAALSARASLARGNHPGAPSWLAYGEELERIGWEGLHEVESWEVFACYLQAGEVTRAKRYFEDILPFVNDRVPRGLTARRWMLAWIEDDRAMMERVLQKKETFIQDDLNLWAIAALARGDNKGAAQFLETCISRYHRHEDEKLLLSFIPLIPALKQGSHPDHAKALDHFGEKIEWLATQWILAKQAKLSKEETIRFFGGDGAKPSQRLMISALREDRAGFETAYRECGGAYDTISFVLVHHLRGKICDIQPGKNPPVLKPAGIKPLTQLVREAAQNSAR